MNIRKMVAGMMAVAGIALLGSAAPMAHANINDVLVSETPSGANFLFTYNVNLTNDETVNSTGPFQATTTISPFLGFVSATASPNFTITSANSGGVSVQYSGPPATVSGAPSGITLGQIFVTSGQSGTGLGTYVSKAQLTSNGLPTTNGGGIIVPGLGPSLLTPEPASTASFAFGALGLLGLIVRARKVRKSSNGLAV